MLKRISRDGTWVCFVIDDYADSIPSVTRLLNEIGRFSEVLKNDRRSLVVKGHLLGKAIVAKKPRDKNRRVWARLLSFVRDSEAKKTFQTLIEFQAKGIESTKPICVLERRDKGMVVDSWLVYEYRDGAPCTVNDLLEVVTQLQQLHAYGYRHTDPNFGNFMLDDDGRIFLIDCKGKPKVGRFGEYYDFKLLSQRNEGVSSEDVNALIEIDTQSPGYWLAALYSGYISARTHIKQLLRRRRSKQDRV